MLLVIFFIAVHLCKFFLERTARPPRPEPLPGTRLFVGGISYNVERAQLQELFAKSGEVVQVFVGFDRETRRSKGYGFVTFATVEAANKAIQELNGFELDGRTLTVSVAKSREESEQSRAERGNSRGGFSGGRGGFRGGRSFNNSRQG